MARKIKTRVSLHYIKLKEHSKGLVNKTQNGASSINSSANETQGGGYESETEYASNQVHDNGEAAVKGFITVTERVGNWGIRETTRNINKWRIRRRTDPKQKRLPAAKRKKTKAGKCRKIKTSRTGKTSAKATAKTGKAAAKGAIKIAHKIKQAIMTLVKNIKLFIKAVLKLLIVTHLI